MQETFSNTGYRSSYSLVLSIGM